MKIVVLAFFKQENCYHEMTSVRKSYISKSVKKWKTITGRKVWNILTFDREFTMTKLLWLISAGSFIKNFLYMTLGLKFLLCLNGKFFDFKNTPSRYYEFLVGIKAFLWDCG